MLQQHVEMLKAIQCVKRSITAGPASPGSPLGPAWLLFGPLVPYNTEITCSNSATVTSPEQNQ